MRGWGEGVKKCLFLSTLRDIDNLLVVAPQIFGHSAASAHQLGARGGLWLHSSEHVLLIITY